MKKKFILIILFNLILLFPFNVWGLVNPTSEFYVNDYADILDDETEEYIVSHSKYLESKTGAQIVVVTVKNLEGKDLESYATELFRKFGIGDKDKNNGLLLLLALEERKFRVEVGYGLEERLTDGLTGRYQDQYIIPYLKNDDWNTGIKNGYSAFYKNLCEYYEIDAGDVEVPNYDDNTNYDNETDIVAGFMSTMFFMFFYGYIFGKKVRYQNTRRGRKEGGYTTLSMLIINILLELGIFILFENVSFIVSSLI